MNINIKAEKEYLPVKSNSFDAGFDCIAKSFTETDDYIEYGLGFSIEIPIGYTGLVFPRSSLSNYDLILCNSVGVIDSGYRGEVKARFKRTGNKIYEIGNRICQLIIIPIPDISFNIKEELDETNNRKGGFGSTNRQVLENGYNVDVP